MTRNTLVSINTVVFLDHDPIPYTVVGYTRDGRYHVRNNQTGKQYIARRNALETAQEYYHQAA